MPKKNGMVIATSTVLYIGSLLQWKQNKHALEQGLKSGLGVTHPIRSIESSLAAQWIAISILAIVLAFTVEQAPEFGGPLTLLILVIALIRYTGTFGIAFNQTQGNTK